MAEYNVNDLFEDVTLKIGEHTFRLRERTLGLGERMQDAQTKFDELPDDAKDEEAADALIAVADLLLEPLGDEKGTRSHAKTLLSKAYKNDQMGIDRIAALVELLRSKMENRLRPPSAEANGG